MLKKANISWSCKQITKMINESKIEFDNAVQRSFVWDVEKSSLLIHSLLTGYPIPPFYAGKDGKTGFYTMLDGKQRMNSIAMFIRGEFKLTNIPDVETDDGQELNLNGSYFADLDEDLQDTIKDSMLTIYYFENITQEQIAELFFRLNNGKPLSNIEVTRATAKSFEHINTLGQHDLFKSACTEKAISRYTNEDIVIKTYAMLTEGRPCLDKKAINPIMQNALFTEQEIDDITKVYDRILEAYQFILSDDADEKLNKKIAKRMLTRTHLLSIVPITYESITNEVSIEAYIEWLQCFFANEGKEPTEYEEYNASCLSGSGHAESVKTRSDIVKKDFDSFVKSWNVA